MNKNDKKILDLKEQIKIKKASIKSTKFIPVTNCVLILDNVTYNLNVINKNDLEYLLVKLTNLIITTKELKLDPTISGYKLSQWIEDITSKIQVLNIKKEENDLFVLEKKLSSLLSSDTAIELELDSISKSLGLV